jgi:hypothetical protein
LWKSSNWAGPSDVIEACARPAIAPLCVAFAPALPSGMAAESHHSCAPFRFRRGASARFEQSLVRYCGSPFPATRTSGRTARSRCRWSSAASWAPRSSEVMLLDSGTEAPSSAHNAGGSCPGRPTDIWPGPEGATCRSGERNLLGCISWFPQDGAAVSEALGGSLSGSGSTLVLWGESAGVRLRLWRSTGSSARSRSARSCLLSGGRR